MIMQLNDIIAQTLVSAGVKRAYGMKGCGSTQMIQALKKSGVRVIHLCHEEAGGFAAGGDAQFSGELAVCLGSIGAGSIHPLNGLYDAHRNNSPVLYIATHVKRDEIGLRVNQETDLHTVFSSCSHYCAILRTPEQLPALLGTAMQTALIRKGAAVIIIPEDLYTATLEFDKPVLLPKIPKVTVIPSEQELQIMANDINEASKVVIYGGKGCEGAHDEVMALAKKLKAPVGWAFRGKHVFDYDNPYPVGMNGLMGHKSCLEALHECDLLLLLGTGFAFTNFYPDQCKIIQIDINGCNLGLRHWVNLGVIGDIKDTLLALDGQLSEKTDDTFATKMTEKYNECQQHVMNLATQRPDDPLHVFPETLSYMIDKKMHYDAMVVADVGTPWAYMSKYIQSLGMRKLYHSCMHGTMANALSSAIGMQAAYPDKQVVAMCGDGGFTMLMGDILTVMREKLPIKIVVFNNGRLDFVALEMKSEGLIDYSLDLKQANFAEMAESIGMKGIRINEPGELDTLLDEAFLYDGPVLIDVLVNPNSLLMPPHITCDMMRNFTEYAWRAFMAGEKATLEEMWEVNMPRQL